MGSNIKSRLPRWLLRWTRRLRDLPTRLREWPEQRRMLGKEAARQIGWSAFRYPIGDPADPPGPLSQIQIPGLPHPFWFREGTSDIPVIRQIFVRREYQMLERLAEVKTILDIGANIGAASVFLLNLFPQARVIAVEPAPQNFATLQKNLAPYRERAVAINAALWSSEAILQLDRGNFRDGLDWSIQVRPGSAPDAEGVQGITMPGLLALQNIQQVDLLKVDIEGAERELFRERTEWLKQVRNMCIELHDEECREVFGRALLPYTYRSLSWEETTVCEALVLK